MIRVSAVTLVGILKMFKWPHRDKSEIRIS